MLEYVILTRHEAEAWQQRYPRNEGDPFSDMFLNDLVRYPPDETVAILALDQGNVVGRILLAHSDILVDGTLRRFLVGQNLLVREEYRQRAVGMQLLVRACRLGKPYIAASVSAEMERIFDSWRHFRRVDSTPMFALGLDRYGVARTARLALQREHAEGKRFGPLDTVRAILSRGWRTVQTRLNASRGFARLSVHEADAVLDSVIGSRRFRVQIPWRRSIIAAALARATDECRAAVFRDTRSIDAPAYLVTLYMRTSEVGVYSMRDVRPLKVAYLNEIFPPLADPDAARYAVSLAAGEARSAGASILLVCASTPGLELACTRLDLVSRKSVYVTPAGLDPAVATVVSDPENWWCRAINEDQFEESYGFECHLGAFA